MKKMLGCGVGQRFEQGLIENAEDRRGTADAERENEDGDGGEARLLCYLAKSETDVVPAHVRLTREDFAHAVGQVFEAFG